MKKQFKANYYTPYKFYSLVLPQSYDNSLTYLEAIYKLQHAYNDLIDQLNEGWTQNNAEKFNNFMADYFASNVTYTEEDKGLHLNFESAYIVDGHKYTPEDETMEIFEGDDEDE